RRWVFIARRCGTSHGVAEQRRWARPNRKRRLENKTMRTGFRLSLLAAAALALPSYAAFTPVNGASLETLLGLGAGGANSLQIFGPGPNTGANEGDEIWTTAIG